MSIWSKLWRGASSHPEFILLKLIYSHKKPCDVHPIAEPPSLSPWATWPPCKWPKHWRTILWCKISGNLKQWHNYVSGSWTAKPYIYPGNQILGPKVARYVVNEHWSTALVNEHSGHGDKIGGSTLCSSRARCLVQLLKNIKIPVSRRFHLYSFLPYLIILLNRVLFNKTSPNHSSVTFLSSAIGTSKREVLRLPVCK